MGEIDFHADSPLFVLVLDADGVIAHASAAARRLLGAAAGRPVAGLLAPEALALLAQQGVRASAGQPLPCVLEWLRADGARLPLACMLDRVRVAPGPDLLRLCAVCDERGQAATTELARSEQLLRGLVQTSSEAMWCIEFTEPVDLTAGDQEVIRQVFENDCHWMMCNPSMARLYDLPEGLDFNKQPVSVYFRRNPENESFVRRIIESNFCIDGGLSIDARHDGSTIYAENTVRANIADNRLLRLWGTVRDVTGYRQAASRLQQQVRDARSILGAIPDAVLVIDRQRRLLGVNPAFETLLGWKADQCLGIDVQALIDLERPLPGGRRWYGCDRQRWTADVRMAAGVPLRCDVHIAPIDEEAPDRFVMTLRPVPVPEPSGVESHA